METLHFFGVFDGHGGAEAALHCAQTLHQRIAEALAATIDPEADETLQQGDRKLCPCLFWTQNLGYDHWVLLAPHLLPQCSLLC